MGDTPHYRVPMSTISEWIGAARPRTLPAAVAPVLVGSGLAVRDGGFRADAMISALIGALAIQVAANFANDASDAARGADTDRVGPPRMVATGRIDVKTMWWAVVTSLAVALVAGVYLVSIAGPVVAAIGVASVLAMLGYVGGPIPYGYRGLGEVFVFVFFGLVATVGSRFVHDRSAPASAWWMGAVMGMLAAAILVTNNLRDIESDAVAGKKTLAVIIGERPTRHLYAGLVYLAFAIIGTTALLGVTPRMTGVAVLLFPLAWPLIRTVRTATDPPSLISALAGTARLQVVVATVIALAAAVM